MNIKEVYKQNPKGFSINLKDMALTTHENGYIVGVTHEAVTNIDDLDNKFKALLKASNLLNVPDNNLYIGGWVDGEANVFYLDLSVWVATRNDANILGQVFNQEEVYNCYEEKCQKVL